MKIKQYPATMVFVPSNLPELDHMVVGTSFDPDRIRAFLHFILTGMLKEGLLVGVDSIHYSRSGYVPLHSRAILKVFLTNHYKLYIDWLIAKGIIKIRTSSNGKKSYVGGEIAQQYRIAGNFLYNPSGLKVYRKETISSHKVNKAFFNYYKKRPLEKDMLPVYHLLKEILNTVKFDIDAAERYCLKAKEIETLKLTKSGNPRPFNAYIIMLDAWNHGFVDWYSVDKFGERLHTFFTNLWTPLRDFCYFQDAPNESLISIDIANNQPFATSISVNSNIIFTGFCTLYSSNK